MFTKLKKLLKTNSLKFFYRIMNTDNFQKTRYILITQQNLRTK